MGKKIVLFTLLAAMALSASCSMPAEQAKQGRQTDRQATQKPVEVLVFAAASLSDALLEVKTEYERTHSDTILTYNFAASGTLQQQIEQGAPADLFISAGVKQMDALRQENIIDQNQTAVLLRNELVLVVPSGSGAGAPQSLDDLKRDSFKLIAIGEPQSVPAGIYTKEALSKKGLWEALLPKLVQAKDVRQVLTYVETGNADAGFVYRTDARTSTKAKIALTIPKELTQPIEYPAAIIKNAEHPAEASRLYEFLRGKDAAAIFQKYGFATVIER